MNEELMIECPRVRIYELEYESEERKRNTYNGRIYWIELIPYSNNEEPKPGIYYS